MQSNSERVVPVMFDLTKLFVGSADPSLFLYGAYSPWLVALSVLIAIFTSGMALQIAGMAKLSDRPMHKQVAIITGSAALGGGIWSMHFIGMMAFQLCTPVAYDREITMLSMLPSLAASWVALQLLARPRMSGAQLLVGGVLVGAGIGAMHYSGMAAMQMAPLLRYDPWFFALSIVVAVVLAMLALWIRFGVIGLRRSLPAGWSIAISGTVMGLAIAGMHYTGMAAARFVGTASAVDQATSQTTFVALAVSLITVALTIFVAAANGLLRYRQLYLLMLASESRLRSIVDTAADGLVTFDAQGLIQTFNPAAERVFGWQAHEVIGKNIDLLFSERDRSGPNPAAPHNRLTDAEPAHPQDYVPSVNREVMTVRKNGAALPIRVAIGRAVLPNQTLYVAFITDISEQREMQEALREAKDRAELAAAAKTTFLANMSHEIRTPMNAIIGFTELLMSASLNDMQRRHLTTVRQSARSLLGLLNGILDTAKLEKGALELEREDFSLKQLVEQVATSMRLTAQSKGLDMRTRYDPALPEFFNGDALRIQQILINLMGNAIKFTHRGSVRLEVFPDHGQVHFAFHDTGIGIAVDRLEKIFDPFAQADPSMSRRFGGTGLGTTIARQLVDLMQGKLSVESQLGEGSVFHVVLPLLAGNPVKVESEHTVRHLESMKILVADDVPQNVELLDAVLSHAGHLVVATSDGAKVVQAFIGAQFDVVLMDVHMPHIDGLEATRQIRAYERAHGRLPTPIIALTASVQEQDRVAAQEAGMNGFASKPVDVAQLMAEIARVRDGTSSPVAGPARSGTHGRLVPVAWTQGLSLWGSEQALAQAIERFLSENSKSFTQLKAHVLASEGQLAAELAHRLRGTCSNLALRELQELTMELEVALLANRADHALAAIAHMDAALEAVQHALRQMPTPATQLAQVGAAVDRDIHSLQYMAKGAIAALRRGELDATVLHLLSTFWRSHNQAQSAHALDSAINHFELDRAEALLQDMLVWLAQQEHSSTGSPA